MLQISNRVYLYFLQGLTVCLVLLLGYQTFFNVKKTSTTELKAGNSTYQQVQSVEPLEDSIETLANFSALDREDDKVLQVSRNIFQNETKSNLPVLQSSKLTNQNYLKPEEINTISKVTPENEQIKEVPDFTFVGIISDSYNGDTKVILTMGTEPLTLPLGSLVKERWQIISVTGDFLLVQDLKTSAQYNLKKGETPVKSVPKKAETVISSEVDRNNQPTQSLFERSNKPMTSKELWEKRAALIRQQKEKNK